MTRCNYTAAPLNILKSKPMKSGSCCGEQSNKKMDKYTYFHDAIYHYVLRQKEKCVLIKMWFDTIMFWGRRQEETSLGLTTTS